MKLNAKEILIIIFLIIILIFSILTLVTEENVPSYVYFCVEICFIIAEVHNILLRHWLIDEDKSKTKDNDKDGNKNA